MSQEDFEFLRGAQIFKSLTDETRRHLLACMASINVNAGERFIRQGEDGDSLYLIRKGSCVVKVERDGEERTVALRKPGELVGEMAICTGERRMAHVDAETDMVVWRMGRVEFDQLCLAHPAVRELVTELVTRRLSESTQTPFRTIGRYMITDIIGEGGWTIVYKGVHEPLNMPVAIKMLKHTMAMDSDFLQKFQNEAKVVARFNHRNIARVHDIEHRYRTVFVVMEYLSGLSLERIVEKNRRLSFSRVLAFLVQIGQGLEYAHKQGVVHQCLKPSNVFVEEGDRVKIVDFGLAWPVNTEKDTGLAGTPRYMAPELIVGEIIDERADIYSWGVTAYELATGEKLFPGNDIREIMNPHTRTPIPDPRLINPDLPPELSAFIHRATQEAPSERYQTIGQALEELEPLAERHGLVRIPNITDFRLTRKALHESEIRFNSIFMAAEDAIFIKNRDLKYTHVNPAMLGLLNMSEEDIIGKTHAEVFGSQSSANFRQMEERVLSGESVETEQTISTTSEPITLNFVRFPILTDDGEVIGMCGIARDVTPRRGAYVKSRRNPDSYPSQAIRQVGALLRSAAETDATILFLGESGSGKDYWARYLHDKSWRAGGPFMAINCAALSPQLVESELFGHEAGAFTGAIRRKRGLLELAEGGTIFLNEIGELSQPLQAKLLTFLDTRSFARVGGEQSLRVDARIVAATNKDLKTEVLAGRFRKDLYFRISVFPITIPRLRERLEDLALLVDHLLDDLMKRMTIPERLSITPAAMDKMAKYSWPGNIRELRNVLERAVIICDKKRITGRDVKIMPDGEVSLTRDEELSTQLLLENGGSLEETMRKGERTLIESALELCAGNVSETARRIGLTREQLKYRIRSLKIGKRGKSHRSG